MKLLVRTSPTAIAVAALVVAGLAPTATWAAGNGNAPVTVYFTRHAEKKTTTTVVGETTTDYDIVYNDANDDATVTPLAGESDGDRLDEVCQGMDDDCAEELNALGLLRADLLVQYFDKKGVVDKLDAVYSSHKIRTFQTVAPTAAAAGLEVVQLPGDETELSAGAGASECPTLEAIRAAEPGSTLLVAGHSGTLYDIMGDGNDDCTGLGLLSDDDPSSDAFPKKSNGKVRDFGDVWTVVIKKGQARLKQRVNLQPTELDVVDRAR